MKCNRREYVFGSYMAKFFVLGFIASAPLGISAHADVLACEKTVNAINFNMGEKTLDKASKITTKAPLFSGGTILCLAEEDAMGALFGKNKNQRQLMERGKIKGLSYQIKYHDLSFKIAQDKTSDVYKETPEDKFWTGSCRVSASGNKIMDCSVRVPGAIFAVRHGTDNIAVEINPAFQRGMGEVIPDINAPFSFSADGRVFFQKDKHMSLPMKFDSRYIAEIGRISDVAQTEGTVEAHFSVRKRGFLSTPEGPAVPRDYAYDFSEFNQALALMKNVRAAAPTK